MRIARLSSPTKVPVSELKGPTKITSHLIDSLPHQVPPASGRVTFDPILAVPFSDGLYTLHGVQALLYARKGPAGEGGDKYVEVQIVQALRSSDVTKHYPLVLLAAQCTSNATVNESFLRYVGLREGAGEPGDKVGKSADDFSEVVEALLSFCRVTESVERKTEKSIGDGSESSYSHGSQGPSSVNRCLDDALNTSRESNADKLASGASSGTGEKSTCSAPEGESSTTGRRSDRGKKIQGAGKSIQKRTCQQTKPVPAKNQTGFGSLRRALFRLK